MKYIKGWMGMITFDIGVAMLFFEQTELASWLVIGFGLGMMSSGFNKKNQEKVDKC